MEFGELKFLGMQDLCILYENKIEAVDLFVVVRLLFSILHPHTIQLLVFSMLHFCYKFHFKNGFLRLRETFGGGGI